MICTVTDCAVAGAGNTVNWNTCTPEFSTARMFTVPNSTVLLKSSFRMVCTCVSALPTVRPAELPVISRVMVSSSSARASSFTFRVKLTAVAKAGMFTVMVPPPTAGVLV